MESNNEVLVYAWAAFDQQTIGAHALPSSMDTYGEEYGWDATDFARAAGGKLVNFYTVGLNAFVPELGIDIPLAVRYEKAPDMNPNHIEGVGGYPIPPVIITGYPGDVAILHRHEDRLFDIGLYGIFDTLANKQLCGYPTHEDEILRLENEKLYVCTYHSLQGDVVRVIDLNNGAQHGIFPIQPAAGDRSSKEFFRSEVSGKLVTFKSRILGPRKFSFRGQELTIANKQHAEYYHLAESSIVDANGKIMVKGHKFSKFFVDAIGFPARLIPQLAEHIS